MCASIFKQILKFINRIKTKCHCCYYKFPKERYSLKEFEKIYQNCSDRPYGILSFEILLQIRMFIESTREPSEKAYFRLLENFIKILDYLCHENSQSLLVRYIKNINDMKNLEKRWEFKSLLNLTLNALKLSLKRINQNFTSRTLKRRVLCLEKVILNFGSINEKNHVIEIYCRILNKLPKLALIRRGLLTTKDSLDKLNKL
jgi:hypothetical protein